MRLPAAATAALVLALLATPGGQSALPPILDMHLHATKADAEGPPPMALCAPGVGYPPLDPRGTWADTFLAFAKKPPCADAIWSPMTDEALMTQTFAIMRRRNIIGMTSGSQVHAWQAALGSRIIPGLQLNVARTPPTVDRLRADFASGRYKVLGEVTNQYSGVSPSDPRFEPYLALAEEMDIPVAIHIGTGPPGAPQLGNPGYEARLHSPFTLEPVLRRHPKLRIYVMHAGWPMLDEMLAMMWTYPQLYVDTGVIGYALPSREFHRYLERIVDAGFGSRVMFGSDQMVWPDAIERAIANIERASFLNAQQKREILFGNAARFLRLTDADVDALTKAPRGSGGR